MKTNKMIVSAVAAVAVMSSWATDWYVDAVNGNDQWDGSTATVPTQEQIEAGGTVAGPRKTLHAMMSDEKVDVGDTVWAAEGDYNEGGTVYGTYKTVNRVQVKAGVTLRASGLRDNTFITGSGGSYSTDPAQNAYSNGAARCVYFLSVPTGADYGGGIVKGFTLRDGRTCPKYDNTEEQGGASTGTGLLVDCLLRDNGCGPSSRGGTMYRGAALRCCFESTDKGCLAYSSSKILDSLILDSAYIYSGGKTYNCTFAGNSYLRAGNSYNCFFIGTGTSNSNQINGNDKTGHYNTFSRSEFNLDKCNQGEGSRVVAEAETPYSAETFRPLAGSVAIDAGDMSHYAAATNGWKAAWLAECGKDYYGEERVVNGKIDVGCGEAQAYSDMIVEDSSGALVVEGIGSESVRIPQGSTIDVVFSRNFTSDRLCTGVEVNGVFYSFGGTTSNVPCTVAFPATPGLDYKVTAVYEENQKDWYVSPEGDDTNKGYHKNCPRKTLDKAMELAKENDGHIVHAAAGTYNESSEGYTDSSRVIVKEGVGLVADEWPEKETIIVGASASGNADSNGNGPGAVRCVNVSSGAYVKGFKLSGGRTDSGKESSNAAKAGGGAYLNGGALIACDVTGNSCAYRGSGVYTENSSWIIGCNVHGNSGGSFEIINGGVANSRVTGTYYGGGIVLNSRMGTVRSNGGARVFNSYLDSTSTGGSSTGPFCTNCVFTSGVATSITGNSTYDPSTCVFSVSAADNLDDKFRPKTNVSPLVDAGSRELYDRYFPAKWVQFKEGDLKGGQRIYNAQIDVGCGEYDWRGDFASMLGAKAAISEMGENVTVDSASDIVVPEGDTIALSMPPRSSGRTTKYELTYTPDGGEATVMTEVSTEAFSYTLAGPCTVQSLTRNGNFTITIR